MRISVFQKNPALRKMHGSAVKPAFINSNLTKEIQFAYQRQIEIQLTNKNK